MPSQLVKLLLQQDPPCSHSALLKAAEEEKDLESTDDHGNTALILSCRSQRTDIAHLLIERGANINARNNSGSSPLIAASMKGQTDLVRTLIEKGADVNLATKSKDTALSLAMWKNHTETALLLIQNGAFVDNIDQFGETTLMDACKNRNERLLEVLLQKTRLQIDQQNNRGYTALMFAAWKNSPACLRKLLEAGANPDLPDHTGISPLSAAARTGNFECCRILIEAGCNLDSEDADGLPALAYLMKQVQQLAVKARKEPSDANLQVAEEGWKTLELLVTKANIPGIACRILLCSFVAEARVKGVTTLLQREDLKDRMDINYVNVDNHNRTAIMHLFEQLPINIEIARQLLAAGADPDATDSNGDSCLHGAVRLGDEEFVKLLLENGADPLLENKKKETPLLIATKKQQQYQQQNNGKDHPVYLLLRGSLQEQQAARDPRRRFLLAAAAGDLNTLQELLLAAKRTTATTTTEPEATVTEEKESADNSSSGKLRLVDFQDAAGRSPLICAAKNNQIAAVRFLIQNKANPTLKDKQQQTAVLVALKQQHTAVAELLLQYMEDWYQQQAKHQQHQPQQQQLEQTSKLLLSISEKIEAALRGKG